MMNWTHHAAPDRFFFVTVSCIFKWSSNEHASLMSTSNDGIKHRLHGLLEKKLKQSIKIYDKWGNGKLHSTFKTIIKKWNEDEPNMSEDNAEYIKRDIEQTKERVFGRIKANKVKSGVSFEWREGSQYKLNSYSSNQDIKHWLHRALTVLLEVEKAYVVSTTQSEKHKMKYSDDERPVRKDKEEKWFISQYRYDKFRRKLLYMYQLIDEGKFDYERKKHRKGHKDLKPEGGAEEQKIYQSRMALSRTPSYPASSRPAQPRAARQPKATSSAPARVNKRLPSFPVYPAY